MSNNIFNNELFEKLVYNKEDGDKNIIEKDFKSYIELLSFKNKILLVLYDKELSQEELIEYDFKKNFSTFQPIRKKLKDENIITISKKETKKEWYVLTLEGELIIKDIIKTFLLNNSYIKENRKQQRQNKYKNIDNDVDKRKDLIKRFFTYIMEEEKVKIRILEGNYYFNIDEILEFDPELCDFILSDFLSAISLFETILESYVNIDDKEKVRGNVMVKGLNTIKSQYLRISEIQTTDEKEFIHTRGLLVYKQPKIKEEVTTLVYGCTNRECQHFDDFIFVNSYLKGCPRCKAPVDLIEEKRKSLLLIDIKDTESENAIRIKVYNGLIKQFQNIRVGEELDVFGHIELVKDSETKDKRITYDRYLVLNDFKQNSNISQLSDEETIKIEKLYNKHKDKGTIRKYLLNEYEKNFPYPKELFNTLLLPQILTFNRGNENIIHPLLIGSPDCGKSTILECMSQMFPKSSQINFKNLSAAKFYGTVTKEGLSDLGLVHTLREGSLIIDEVDKDEDSLNKSSEMFNEVLEQQKANKQKAGINVCVENVNLRVYKIMNPDPSGRLKTLDWIKKNVHISTVTRFFVIDFDSFMKDKYFKFIIKNSAKNGLKVFNDYDFETRRNLILYLRKQQVDLTEIEEPLIQLMYGLRVLTKNNEAASRNIKQIKNIITGLCRLKGIDTATENELKDAFNLVKWIFETQGLKIDTPEEKVEDLPLPFEVKV